jgi:hypothetical protein
MNTSPNRDSENSRSREKDVTARLRDLLAGKRWEVLRHYWWRRANGGSSGLKDAYADWPGSSRAQWISRERDRENSNSAAVVSAKAQLSLLRTLISDQMLNDATHQSIREIVNIIESKEVSLVFGGHFKAGKSSTLNAVLGRPLLPSGRLPETGAICAIRSGVEDSAAVQRSGRSIPVECSTEMIRSVCSIVDRETGGPRDLSDIDRIEVTLQRACIPQDVVWIDSPGITDDHAMDECARRAAAEADVLVWVLWTKHPVGEPEAEFLRRYLKERGVASAVFLLNCFLTEDCEDIWKQYGDQDVPQISRKLEEVVGPMGFSEVAPLVMLPISARAIREVDRDAFGGPELREFLRQFDSPCHPRVQRTRWHRASLALDQLAFEHEQAFYAVRKQNSRLGIELRKAEETAHQAEVSQLQIVNIHLREFLLGWSRAAREAGREVADSLNLLNLWSNGGKQGPGLAQRVNQLGSVHYSTLRHGIEQHLAERSFSSGTALKIGEILEPLLSNSLESYVPKAVMDSKAWIKLGVAAVLVFLAIALVANKGVAAISNALLLIGGIVALNCASTQLKRIRQAIAAAVEKFVLDLEQKIEKVAPQVSAGFPHMVDLENHPGPDREEETRLELASTILRNVAKEARKISESFTV